ncbi:homoserine dehydrogenase [Arthrobacter sp. PM3]|uniref:homoserine dehydrogenase n=1 Tax=Arthrobacter sp. PM3 TaxID=2017685 RepID=UPI000E10BF41|nr:homoserine dehydrogenase [Arthrobacter sp. PM3]AXJ09988.1 homoserine dehydrogenase [Arthrobacter sp. PM3]
MPSRFQPTVPLLLSGYGNVGQSFVNLVPLQETGIHVAGIRGHHTEVRLGEEPVVPERSSWEPLGSIDDALTATRAAVLVQALPSSEEAHSRATHEAIAALRRGVHVVTATKSHLVSHWRELQRAAEIGRSRIRISGATGAALPAADLARLGVRGLGCNAVRACPNGTSTFVLDQLSGGAGLADAILEAQRRGIAESDPSADLSGQDAATKVRLMTGLVWGWDVSRMKVQLDPIDHTASARALAAAGQGRRLRAVASASLDRPMLVSVRLESVAAQDPLRHIAGPEKAVVFVCPDAGDITVQGGRSSPQGAAVAMLKDVLNLVDAESPGF